MNSLIGPLEAVLFAAGSDGLTLEDMAAILQLSTDETKALCQQLQEDYMRRDAGIQLVELASAWQLVTRPEHEVFLRRMATSPASATLSAAALEALAIVAYRQPILRSDIESIRGVQSDGVISTLVHRQLIHGVGRHDGPGKPILYGTTDTFLQLFGLRDISDLPPLPVDKSIPSDSEFFHMTEDLPRD